MRATITAAILALTITPAGRRWATIISTRCVGCQASPLPLNG